MAFSDHTSVRLGDIQVTVRRLTLAELRRARTDFAEGRDLLGEAAVRLVAEHCRVDDKPLDPEGLSLPQMRTLLTELVGIPDGSPLSDFIGLLC